MSMREGSDSKDAFDFLLLFDRATGSPKVNYFMVDPRSPTYLLPKLNRIRFKQLQDVSGHRPVVLNGSLYVIGGRDWHTGKYLAAVRRYDPRTNTWSEAKALGVPRCRFTAVALDGFIYVLGGEIQNSKVTESVERYDPTADEWTEVAPLPQARVDHASCALGGRIYVSGGISNLKHRCSNVFCELFTIVDWHPTLTEAAGGDVSLLSGIDGVSQWQSLSTGGSGPRDEFVYNINDVKNCSALRWKNFKLIQGFPGSPEGWYVTSEMTNQMTEEPVKVKHDPSEYTLYDIDADPSERNNVLDQYPEIVQKMKSHLDEYKQLMHPSIVTDIVKESPPSPLLEFLNRVWESGFLLRQLVE